MKRHAIEQLLPEIFRRSVGTGTPIDALLSEMEFFHAPAEALLADVEQLFNPHDTPAAFLPYLASWLDLDRFFEMSGGRAAPGAEAITSGSGRLRELIARAAWLSSWRGTAVGLRAFLQTATGAGALTIDEGRSESGNGNDGAGDGGAARPFHIRVRLPASMAPHRALIGRIVAAEKPACVTAQIEYEEVKTDNPSEETEHGPRI